MADRTPLKFADRSATSPGAISGDDPFAELTRIMGFDPRQPVKPQADPVMADDFDIDLEKELMGEFGLDADEGISAAENAPAPEVAGLRAHDDLRAHNDTHARDGLHVHDGTAGYDLDEAVAASMQDFELDANDVHAGDEAQHQAAPEVEFERDFDEDLARALDAHAEPHLQWPVEEEAVAPVAEEMAEPVEAAHDFDAHFDEAMASVDMDFDAPAVSAHEPDASQAAEAVAHDSAGRDEEGTADPFEEIFASLGHQDRPAAAAVAEPAAPAAASEERSLEDELNALLGNMGARISKPGSAASPFSWASNAQANPVPAADPFAVAAVGYGAQQQALQPEQHGAVEAETHADIDAGIDAMLLEELATSDIADETKAETPADHTGADFDAADFEAFVRDDAAERAAAPVPETPILARSWNRMVSPPAAIQDQPKATVVREAEVSEPASFEGPQPVAAEAHYSSASAYRPVSEPAPYEPEAAAEPDETAPAAAYDEIPDVETVDVPERVEALADDLDLPELVFEEDRPAKTAFDDLDAEFAGLLNELNDTEEAPVPPPSYDDEPYEAGFRHVAAQDQGNAPAYAEHRPAQAAAVAPHDDGFDAAATPDMRPFAPVETFAADELEYDPGLDEEMAVPGLAENAVQPRRRGLLIAAVVAGVAVVGGIGAFALSPGGGGDGAPVLVKADNAPIKVKPENPGGTVVPNQDNKVYEAVAKGIQPAAPEQQKLVANTQEPVNVNTAAPQNRVVDLSPGETDDVATTGTAASDAGDAAPTAKSEDRIEPSADQTAAASSNQDVALVTPRKVRTMIVKPDGTLAPREETEPAAPQVAATEPADPAPQRVVSAPAQAGDRTGAVAPAADAAAGQSAPKPAAKANAQSVTTPATVAAVPQRPSDQPVDIVGEVKPDEVASISPAAASAGSWSMQIASQPSADSAQSTYKDLAKRYASVLDGHTANIVKADIAGKGTFYRVRIPANSRNDAISLCESYKAAGGNCFVSK